MTDREFQDRVQAEFYRPRTALEMLDPNRAYIATVTGICYNKFVHSAECGNSPSQERNLENG
jgi:hypothetical protein